jgi:transposase
MPRFVPIPTRLAVWNAHLDGQDTTTLADCFDLSPRTVRSILQHGRLHGGVFLPPNYRAGPAASDFTPSLRQQVLALRQQHPLWGAELVRIWLEDHCPAEPLPSPPTIRRWLKEAGLSPARAGRKSTPPARACAPHEVWQVDAADQIRLASDQQVSWLRVVDECSGAVLQTVVFPSVWNRVSLADTQRTLRRLFARWGLPGRLRLDNGFPWGNWSELPTALGLWLVGLGMGLHFNRPRQPQQNGVVERSHQTADTWVEPQTCDSPQELQWRLDEMDLIQRERYPRACGLSRWQLYPRLRLGGRGYDASQEQQKWSLQAARLYLSRRVARRKVSQKGQVTVYAQRYGVGALHAGKQACVQYDGLTNEWLFGDEHGNEWCRQPAQQITQERIMALDISA